MSMVGRRENNQEKQHYRGNKLQFLIHKHGALLPVHKQVDFKSLDNQEIGNRQQYRRINELYT